jgi:hypothetical protein
MVILKKKPSVNFTKIPFGKKINAIVAILKE